MPNGSRYRWAVYALYGCLALTGVSFLNSVQGYFKTPHFAEMSAGAAEQFMNTSATVSLLQVGAIVVSGIFFLRWWHRSLKNFGLLGAGIKGDLGWATVSWFVPIAAWFVPLQFTQQMTESGERPGPNLYGWWGTWVIGNLLSRLTSRLMDNAETLADVQRGFGFAALSELLTIVSGFLLLPIMRFIQERQVQLAVQQRQARRKEAPAHLSGFPPNP